MPMITVQAAIYWELRARILEHQARVAAFDAQLAQLFARAGLTPGVDYRLDDATCSATPVSEAQ